MKRSGRLSRKGSKQNSEEQKQHEKWCNSVDRHTKGKCVYALADRTHVCMSFGRRRIEHHHVITKGSHPELRYEPRNGICCCPAAHDSFHSKGLMHTLTILKTAGINKVVSFVCEKKGIDMTKIIKVQDHEKFSKSESPSQHMAALMMNMKPGDRYFVACDHDVRSLSCIRAAGTYYTGKRTDGSLISVQKCIYKDTGERGVIVSCKQPLVV